MGNPMMMGPSMDEMIAFFAGAPDMPGPEKHGKPGLENDVEEIKCMLKKLMCMLSKLPMDDVSDPKEDEMFEMRYMEDGEPDWGYAKDMCVACLTGAEHPEHDEEGGQKPAGDEGEGKESLFKQMKKGDL